MNGFGFIEYKDALDARDVVPGKQARSTTILGLVLVFPLGLRCSVCSMANLLFVFVSRSLPYVAILSCGPHQPKP